MSLLSSSELAKELGVTKGRVSQFVAAGKLTGCYSGDGRARRFDLGKVTEALGRRLDPGQMLGNGAGTKRVLASLQQGLDHPSKEMPVAKDPREFPAGASVLSPSDPTGYELARAQSATEDARRKRRENLLAEGLYVLTSEVELQVARALGQEIKEFEGVLRDGARKIADDLGVDFLKARQILVQAFRAHRALRSSVLDQQSAQSEMTEAETEADI